MHSPVFVVLNRIQVGIDLVVLLRTSLQLSDPIAVISYYSVTALLMDSRNTVCHVEESIVEEYTALLRFQRRKKVLEEEAKNC